MKYYCLVGSIEFCRLGHNFLIVKVYAISKRWAYIILHVLRGVRKVFSRWGRKVRETFPPPPRRDSEGEIKGITGKTQHFSFLWTVRNSPPPYAINWIQNIYVFWLFNNLHIYAYRQMFSMYIGVLDLLNMFLVNDVFLFPHLDYLINCNLFLPFFVFNPKILNSVVSSYHHLSNPI